MESSGPQSADVLIRSRRRIRYRTFARVMDVREEFEHYYVDEESKLTKGRGRSRGWFVQFDGSYESIHFGPTRPQITVGDLWTATFEKATPEQEAQYGKK